jgi:hypothetical protein
MSAWFRPLDVDRISNCNRSPAPWRLYWFSVSRFGRLSFDLSHPSCRFESQFRIFGLVSSPQYIIAGFHVTLVSTLRRRVRVVLLSTPRGFWRFTWFFVSPFEWLALSHTSCRIEQHSCLSYWVVSMEVASGFHVTFDFFVRKIRNRGNFIFMVLVRSSSYFFYSLSVLEFVVRFRRWRTSRRKRLPSASTWKMSLISPVELRLTKSFPLRQARGHLLGDSILLLDILIVGASDSERSLFLISELSCLVFVYFCVGTRAVPR